MSFRLRWLGRLINDTDGSWKKVGQYWFNKLGGLKLLLNCNFDVGNFKFFSDKLPLFYIEILKAWYFLRQKENINDVNLDKQLLWYNKYVTIDGMPLFYKDWYHYGILYLSDIYKQNDFITVSSVINMLHGKRTKSNAFFIISS